MANLIESKYEQLKCTVSGRVTEESRKEGTKHYGNWASKQKKYRWDASDYNHRGFRAVYFERLFQKRAELVREALDYCDSDLPNFLENDNLKVVSFGCGPGCDLLGFHQYYKEKKDKRIAELKKRVRLRKQQQQQTSNTGQHDSRQAQSRSSIDDTSAMIKQLQSAKVSFTGYDSSTGWREYVETLRYTFKEAHIDKSFVDRMPPVDVAILCYFSHSANLHEQSESAFWKSLKQKCQVILVMDTTYKKEEFNSMLTALGFKEMDCVLQDEDERNVYTTLWSRSTAR